MEASAGLRHTSLFLESFLPLATTGHWNLASGITIVIVRGDVIAFTGQRILDCMREEGCKRNRRQSIIRGGV